MQREEKIALQVESQRIGLVLVPGFSLVGFSAVVEPVHVANRLSKQKLFDWDLLTLDGSAAHTSSGLAIQADAALNRNETVYDLVVVCSGFFERGAATSKTLLDWLRKQASKGCTIGAISTGSEILANAGLLNNHTCTIHWEYEESFRENHPKAIVTGGIYELGKKRITAAGGVAALDMMLAWIASQHDEYLVTAIAEQFVHSTSREPGSLQRKAELRLVRRRSPKLAKAIELMMANIEEPLTTTQIASEIGVSPRQLERLFSKYRKKSPRYYYQELRLNHARYLVFNSGLSLTQVSIAAGFSSQSHFSRRYRNFFQTTPSQDRQIAHF